MRPSISRLREVLLYEPDTGLLRWRIAITNAISIGSTAGTIIDGYIRVQVDGHRVRAHIVAWALTTGEWPALNLDHKDLDGLNNRWDNLREATYRQNSANSKGNGKNLKGAYFNKGKWQAQITEGGKTRYLGTFDTMEKAHEAYVEAARAAFGEFARAA